MSRAAPSIVVVGVESTGKTALVSELARHTGWPSVPEVARAWLAERDDRYIEEDLATIARLQWRAEAEARRASTPVIVDTDLVVLRIWSEARFGRCAPWILEHLRQRQPAIYLLTAPDLPWVPDRQRESPKPAERADLHQRYRALLSELGHPWHEITGRGEDRTLLALDVIRDRFPGV